MLKMKVRGCQESDSRAFEKEMGRGKSSRVKRM
jgi:hypothetical protein